MRKILITGSGGLIGSDLFDALRASYGDENVIASDIRNTHEARRFEFLDIRDRGRLKTILEKYDVGSVYHLAGLLSAGGEKNPGLAWEINLNGLMNVLDEAREFDCKVFWPSSIAVYGPTTPKIRVPQHTSFEPETVYGITKMTGELLCKYYHDKFGVDVRSLRYPGINGWKGDPGDGTTEYAMHIFYSAFRENAYECFLSPDTRLPMMYIDDAIRGTIELMAAPRENLTERMAYNFAAINFTPAELVEEVKRLFPGFRITYKPDVRQEIAATWAQSIDDSAARRDWGWKEAYDLEKMAKALYSGIKGRIYHG